MTQGRQTVQNCVVWQDVQKCFSQHVDSICWQALLNPCYPATHMIVCRGCQVLAMNAVFGCPEELSCSPWGTARRLFGSMFHLCFLIKAPTSHSLKHRTLCNHTVIYAHLPLQPDLHLFTTCLSVAHFAVFVPEIDIAHEYVHTCAFQLLLLCG